MNDQCRELERQCEYLREEVYRHLTLAENLVSNRLQTILPSIIEFFIKTLIVYGVIIILFLAPQMNVSKIVLLILAILLFASVVMWYWERLIKQSDINNIVEVTHILSDHHMNIFDKYLDMLKECCAKLDEKRCFSEPYCLDIKMLETTARTLRSR
jgi:hypothetical protein